MSRNSTPRRSAKQHKQSARLRAHARNERPGTGPGGAPDILALLHVGARSAHGPLAHEALLDQTVDELVRAGAHTDPEAALSAELLRSIDALYERGWQPLDVTHVVRRQTTKRVVLLLRDVVTTHARQVRAHETAPDDWLEQLAAATDGAPGNGAIDAGRADDSVVNHWRCALGPASVVAEGLYDALLLLGLLLNLPVLAPIGPAPSQWSVALRGPQRARLATANPKVLGRIRALLAKAEGTTFEAEAEAFTAKAQDLMTRHAIDSTVLLAADHHDLRGDVVARRVHLDNPYAAEKVDLLSIVCRANGVRTVWHNGLGFATVIGLPVDLEVSELLFTSLLVQVNRAMGEATRDRAHSGSRTFRQAFLVAYAHRIGERLDDAAGHANEQAAHEYGVSLVPIMEARDEAVESEYTRMFPHTRALRGRRLDARGWAAGRAAADRAVLDQGRHRLNS